MLGAWLAFILPVIVAIVTAAGVILRVLFRIEAVVAQPHKAVIALGDRLGLVWVPDTVDGLGRWFPKATTTDVA